MSITVIQSPEAVMPAGNEILLKLQTDNRYSNAGSKAGLTISFSGIETFAGRTFVLIWGDNNIIFSLAETPDDSGKQIRKATEGQPVDYWMTLFLEDLSRNYYLQRDFDFAIDTGSDTITLVAKQSGDDYDLTVPFNNVTNVEFTPVAGEDPVQRENFELICLTEIFDNGTWRKLAEDRLAPDADDQASFFLQDLLDPELIAEFTWPEVSETYHALRSNHIKRYRYSFAELFDDEIQRMSSPGSARAILGAFDYKMIAGLNGIEYSFTDFIITYKSFLTWQPISKTINRTQPEKLFFLVFNNINSLELHIKVYYTDGTNSDDQELFTFSDVNQYDVYEFMVGFSQIDFSKFSSKTVASYDIWLEDNAGNIQSQVRTFVLDAKTYRHERIFLFRNSFGGFDTLRATGRKTQLNEYERMIRDRNDEGFSLQGHYQVLERSIFSINSGWLSLAQRNWLRELLLSREAYEILGGYKFPILITDDKREFRDDDNYLYSLEINYKYAFKDPAFTGDYTSMPLLAENLEILLNEEGEPLYA